MVISEYVLDIWKLQSRHGDKHGDKGIVTNRVDVCTHLSRSNLVY